MVGVVTWVEKSVVAILLCATVLIVEENVDLVYDIALHFIIEKYFLVY